MVLTENYNVRPFLKWAGGKTQLLPVINEKLPHEELKNGTIRTYIEPFVGSGAVLFDVLKKYPQIEEAFIYDINPELINTYNSIKYDVESLINILDKMESDYIPLDNENRKKYYYNQRQEFNDTLDDFSIYNESDYSIQRAAQFIFLNRTCFNGLYRVNKKGLFNVPMGQYKNPKICNSELLRDVSKFLERVSIHLGDYRESYDPTDKSTFVYFDPPYRPLNASSSFTSYSKYDFNDKNQQELSEYYRKLDEKGAYLMLSNSDPKNVSSSDNFFDDLYEGYNINRVKASRRINSNAKKRGEITELLISNY